MVVWLSQVVEHWLCTAVSWVRSPVLACGMAVVVKLDRVFIPGFLSHIMVSFANTDHTVQPKMEQTDGAQGQAMCTDGLFCHYNLYAHTPEWYLLNKFWPQCHFPIFDTI